jgi:hypothetical protein
MVTFRVKPSTYKFKSHQKKIEDNETKNKPKVISDYHESKIRVQLHM